MDLEASILEKLSTIEERYEELNQLLSDPAVVNDVDRYRQHAQDHAALAEILKLSKRFQDIRRELDDLEEVRTENADDEELLALAEGEYQELLTRKEQTLNRLMQLMVPRDVEDTKNVVLEIRAGTGGDEATLFARDLFRMYSRYAEAQGWNQEILDVHQTGVGGWKEIIAVIEGKGAYNRLKYESGVHRVQRIPETETSGRIHTSAVTVAVLPEAEAVEVDISDDDLRIDRFCSSGPGGQSVNTTYSAIRITHIPTGLVVSCQDEKSQHKNKEKALRVLRSRLYDMRQQELMKERAQERKSQIGTGDRSEKIRTYNFPQNRVTDHRIHYTSHQLEAILDGDLSGLIEALHSHFNAERLREELAV